MYSLLLGLHIIVCLLLVIVVLLQSGKAADLAGAFGGMGSQSTFGPRGAATFLSKLTTTLAVLFMVTSLSLWIFASNRSAPKTVVEGVQPKQTTQTTQTPAATDTEKATPTEDTNTKGEQQDTGNPAASTSESGTSQENNSPDAQKKEKESGQEQPPGQY
ncbi:MAG: preprotein translocase subunit SecG [Candidatus Aminicenantes bacterium]